MICCKIVTNFNNTSGNFNQLIEKISTIGEWLWNNGILFFSDTIGDIDKSKINRIMNKCGYKDFYINIYDKSNIPQENDEVNIWLTDKLIKINYQLCEKENQKAFREISKGLDMLDKQIELLKEKKSKSDT